MAVSVASDSVASVEGSDTERTISGEDALGCFMVVFIVEIAMDNGKNMVVVAAGLVSVDHSIFEGAFGASPEFQAPKVKAGLPELKPFADIVGLRSAFLNSWSSSESIIFGSRLACSRNAAIFPAGPGLSHD